MRRLLRMSGGAVQTVLSPRSFFVSAADFHRNPAVLRENGARDAPVSPPQISAGTLRL